MSMEELQDLFIARFAPLSQKHMLDRQWMIIYMVRDDIAKAVDNLNETDKANVASDGK